jgi:hypothetical protein
MYEAIVENLSTLTNLLLTDGRALMKAGGVEKFLITAVALMLVFLAARVVRRKRGVPESFRARRTVANKRSFGRLFESQRSPALKPCPNCAEQLSLSAIICETCDYNFLAERPGRGQNLLPSPQPMADEVAEQRITSLT